MNKADADKWVLAAQGELGDVVNWEQDFEAFERARSLLCLLEEIGDDEVDWQYLLQGLPNLSIIESMEFPPLYVEDAFDSIDGFLTIVGEPLTEAPGMSFNRIEIYVDRNSVDRLIEQFDILSDRLEEYKPLAPYV